MIVSYYMMASIKECPYLHLYGVKIQKNAEAMEMQYICR